MRHICAWCQTELAGSDGGSMEVSHGICFACFQQLAATRANEGSEAENREKHEHKPAPDNIDF